MGKRHFQSRKFAFAVIGTVAVLWVYLVSVGLLCFVPEVATHVVTLANITIVFLGSVTGVMVAGQSFVDWRHNSSSQYVTAETKEQRYEEKNIAFTEKIERPRDYDSEDLE